MAQQRHHVFVAAQCAQGGLRAARKRCQTQHGARNHAERAFAADKELAQVVAGVVLLHLVERADHGAIGEHRFQPEHLVAHHAVSDHAVAAGIGGDIAANLATAARAQVHRKKPVGGARGVLRGLQRGAGQHGHGAGLRVDFFHAAHALQRQHQFAAGRGSRARQPGQASLRHHRLPAAIADRQYRRHLGRAARARHRHRRPGIERRVPVLAEAGFDGIANLQAGGVECAGQFGQQGGGVLHGCHREPFRLRG
ncbi:hypothetical protein D9M68_611380 [compost metagenome]